MLVPVNFSIDQSMVEVSAAVYEPMKDSNQTSTAELELTPIFRALTLRAVSRYEHPKSDQRGAPSLTSLPAAPHGAGGRHRISDSVGRHSIMQTAGRHAAIRHGEA